MKGQPHGIGLGTWCFGDDPYWPGQKHTDSLKCLDAALRLGIGHFDTAQVYGNGRAEQLLGQRIRLSEKQPLVATKLFPCPPSSVPKRIEISRKRLFLDSIDIVYIHWPKPGHDLRPMMEALEKERSLGRIGSIGVSNFSVQEMIDLSNAGNIDICQSAYSLLWRNPERELLPYCRQNKITCVAYSPLAQGLLSGKYPTGELPEQDPRQRILPADPSLRELLAHFLSDFLALAAELSLSPVILALAWVLAQKDFQALVAGARNRAQCELIVEAGTHQLSNESITTLTRLSDQFWDYTEQQLGIAASDDIFGHRRTHA